MSPIRCLAALLLSCCALIPSTLLGQNKSGWRISPEKINIQVGADRPLQLLDDSAQELNGATWEVNNPDLAEIRQEDRLVILTARAAGTVVVSATIGQETRTEEIRIWSASRPMPLGTSNWGVHPIGREIGDIPAVPTPGAPDIYSLEQTSEGDTYLRATRDDGIQVWAWKLPEQTRDVELVCGDWTGGALISADRNDGFALYTIDNKGKVRWQREFQGVRKSHAYNREQLLHIVSQSRDGFVTTLTGLDAISGSPKFTLTIPVSYQRDVNLSHDNTNYSCVTGTSTKNQKSDVSRVYVNMDGLAYVAFRQSAWSLDAGDCKTGAVVNPSSIKLARNDKIVLWQIHPDGTHASFVIEESNIKQAYSAPINITYPTTALLTDNMNGSLIPIRVSHLRTGTNVDDTPEEFIYRVNENGDLVYKLPLPNYPGALHDEVVIGSNELGFATRGGILIAFNVTEGKELWRWDSGTEDVSVLAALVDGSCLVQTPTQVVDVWSPTRSKVYMSGRAMLTWQGQLLRKHN